jgi:hypothetical protein
VIGYGSSFSGVEHGQDPVVIHLDDLEGARVASKARSPKRKIRKAQALLCEAPVLAQCEGCGRRVLRGIDQGLLYKVDPLPINETGELVAKLNNRSSYRIIGDRLLTFRDHFNISQDRLKNRPAVLASHICGPVNLAYLDPGKVVSVAAYLSTIDQAYLPDEPFYEAMRIIQGILPAVAVNSDEPPF